MERSFYRHRKEDKMILGEKIIALRKRMNWSQEELAEKLAGRLPQISLSVGADMNKTADTLRLLAACDAVVLAEQRGTSKCREILQEKEAVDTLKKPILGCIVL